MQCEATEERCTMHRPQSNEDTVVISAEFAVLVWQFAECLACLSVIVSRSSSVNT